jgi:hypothetical protein
MEGARAPAVLKQESLDDDLSDSSLSNYTQTEDIRKMFAKTPAGIAEQLAKGGQQRQRPVNESDLQTSPSQDDGEAFDQNPRQQPGSVPVSQLAQKNLVGLEQESDNTSSDDDDA